MPWASIAASLYAAYGDKETLFRKVLDRYALGPANFLVKALQQPTARAVAQELWRSGRNQGKGSSAWVSAGSGRAGLCRGERASAARVIVAP